VSRARLASVAPPSREERPIAEELAPVVASEAIAATQAEAVRRWIAEMALRCVRVERASRGGDDGT
jgi:hypothetical protein